MPETVHVIEQNGYEMLSVAEKMEGMLAADEVDLNGREAFIVSSAERTIGGAAAANAEFILAAVTALRRRGATRVHVADPSPPGLPGWRLQFDSRQLARLRDSANIVNVHLSQKLHVRSKNPNIQDYVRLPEMCCGGVFLLALPKAGTDVLRTVTTSASTLLTLLEDHDRLAFHDWRLSRKLADLYLVRRPDYVIYDAIVCGEGQGPSHPSPRSFGLMVGGRNGVCTDTVMSSLMGFDPASIGHLRLLSDAGAGTSSLRLISVDPPDALAKREQFKQADWNIENLSDKLTVFGGSKTHCAAGCVGMMRQALEPWIATAFLDWKEPVYVVTGKPLDQVEIGMKHGKTTLVVGDCAAEHGWLGLHVRGCPPSPESIELALLRVLSVRGARGLRMRLAMLAGVPPCYAAEALRRIAMPDSTPLPTSIPALASIAARTRLSNLSASGIAARISRRLPKKKK